MKPSLGRVVIVPMNPDLNNGADEAPASIVRVWPLNANGEQLVNLRVTGDNAAAPEWRTSVKLHDERPENPQHDAWWPPRV